MPALSASHGFAEASNSFTAKTHLPEEVVGLDRVTRTFVTPAGSINVLNGLSLVISQGDFAMVTGPSGSGKSTLLNISSLLDTPDTGVVRFLGNSVTNFSDKNLSRIRAEKLGMVFQSYHLMARRTVLENIQFRFRYGNISRKEAKVRSIAAAEQAGISHLLHRKAYLLSGGEMQRVAIARAIALEPVLLLADEPTGNLDQENSARIMELFSELHRGGLTILMVTHNPEMLDYASRHLVCDTGRLTESSDTA